MTIQAVGFTATPLAEYNIDKKDLVYGYKESIGYFLRDLCKAKNSSSYTKSVSSIQRVLGRSSEESLDYKSFAASIKHKPVSDKTKHSHEIRRYCKDAILWQVKRGAKVHFCLDDVNQYHVVTKKKSFITDSELRFIYRHRDDKDFIDKVVFWDKNGLNWSTCPAPWVKFPELWQMYSPRSESESYVNDSPESSNFEK